MLSSRAATFFLHFVNLCTFTVIVHSAPSKKPLPIELVDGKLEFNLLQNRPQPENLIKLANTLVPPYSYPYAARNVTEGLNQLPDEIVCELLEHCDVASQRSLVATSRAIPRIFNMNPYISFMPIVREMLPTSSLAQQATIAQIIVAARNLALSLFASIVTTPDDQSIQERGLELFEKVCAISNAGIPGLVIDELPPYPFKAKDRYLQDARVGNAQPLISMIEQYLQIPACLKAEDEPLFIEHLKTAMIQGNSQAIKLFTIIDQRDGIINRAHYHDEYCFQINELNFDTDPINDFILLSRDDIFNMAVNGDNDAQQCYLREIYHDTSESPETVFNRLMQLAHQTRAPGAHDLLSKLVAVHRTEYPEQPLMQALYSQTKQDKIFAQFILALYGAEHATRDLIHDVTTRHGRVMNSPMYIAPDAQKRNEAVAYYCLKYLSWLYRSTLSHS